jgi:membrane protein DedA with SNARE-associated domain
MQLVPFLLYSTFGTALWVGLLTYAGLLLGQNYKLVEKFLGPASGVVLVALIVAFGIWIARRKKKQQFKEM